MAGAQASVHRQTAEPSASPARASTEGAVHSPGHLDCPACELYRLRLAGPEQFAALRLRDAAPLWLRDHAGSIESKTIRDYQYYIRSLTAFFGELPLDRIHLGHVHGYREQRLRTAGPSCINHEINTLKQVLERAGLWAELARFYKPLRLPKATVGQALEPEDEARLFQVAASNPRWRIAYWCSLLSATTAAGPQEISHLHLRDVDLSARTMRIRDGLKNVHRDRVVPLNDTATWAAGQILKRYHKIVRRFRLSPDAEHFILPGRGRRTQYDPWKPMGSWKKAWRALRLAADLPALRMYDLRHHALTRLLEDPEISDQVVEEIAGHVSHEMKKRYSHSRQKPKRDAVSKLEIQRPPQAENGRMSACGNARPKSG